MKPIDTKTHGYLDYIVGIFLIASPSLFDLNPHATESIIFYSLGGAGILYSLLTNYELGVLKLIPMKLHLTIDAVSGIFLATSPWLLGFAERVYAPHLALGIFEIVAAIVTNPKPVRQITDNTI